MLKFFVGAIVLVSPTTGSFCYKMIESASIEFISNGQKLVNLLVGGLDSPIFSAADLNNDGIEDLFIFDFNGKSKSCFLTVFEDNQFKTEYFKKQSLCIPNYVLPIKIKYKSNTNSSILHT